MTVMGVHIKVYACTLYLRCLTVEHERGREGGWERGREGGKKGARDRKGRKGNRVRSLVRSLPLLYNIYSYPAHLTGASCN